MSDEPITFTKVKLPWGWLSNMSPHGIKYDDLWWPTAEHLFQALRFPRSSPVRAAIREAGNSPMTAKMVARSHDNEMDITRCGEGDLDNMRRVLELKIEQHPVLRDALLGSGNRPIIEDVTRRAQKGAAMFWGAALINGEWKGENRLGRMWMDVRAELRAEAERAGQ